MHDNEDGDTSRETGHLRNDESEALESDHSDHKDDNSGGRSQRSVKVVPMAQRLQELLKEGNTHSRQRLHNQKHLGHGMAMGPGPSMKSFVHIARSYAAVSSLHMIVHLPVSKRSL